MSNSSFDAKARFRERGTWSATGPDGSGYLRYDTVKYTIGSFVYTFFAVRDIAANEAAPSLTLNTDVWKRVARGSAFALADGSIVTRNADGDNITVNATTNSLLVVNNGLPAFRPITEVVEGTGGMFTGYELSRDQNIYSSGSQQQFLISGGDPWYYGNLLERIATNRTSTGIPSIGYGEPYYLGAGATAKVSKLYVGYRCALGISSSDATHVYAIGLDAGRFGSGMDITNSPTRIVSNEMERIEYFVTNEIPISFIITSINEAHNRYTNGFGDGTALTGGAVSLFIAGEGTDSSGNATNGRVFVSAGAVLTNTGFLAGNTADGTIREITGFTLFDSSTDVILWGEIINNLVVFISRTAVYGLGTLVTNVTDAPAATSTVTRLEEFTRGLDQIDANNVNGFSAVGVDGGHGFRINTVITGTQARATNFRTEFPNRNGKNIR